MLPINRNHVSLHVVLSKSFGSLPESQAEPNIPPVAESVKGVDKKGMMVGSEVILDLWNIFLRQVPSR